MGCTLLESDKMKSLFLLSLTLLYSCISLAQVKIGGDPKSLKDRIKNNTSYTGTYFYIVHLKAPKQIEQGYIYLIKK
jgi:hypothetical protein